MTFANRCVLFGVRVAAMGLRERLPDVEDALAILKFSRIGRVRCMRPGVWVPV